MGKNGQSTNSLQIELSGTTDHRTPNIFKLLSAMRALKGSSTLLLRVREKLVRLYFRRHRMLDGSMQYTLSPLGEWHYVKKYDFIPEVRPHPPVGAIWFQDYTNDWVENFSGGSCNSCWVRDENMHWVWVTDTPHFDRDWFDGKGWRFPDYWITSDMYALYSIGSDEVSTIVKLPEVKNG